MKFLPLHSRSQAPANRVFLKGPDKEIHSNSLLNSLGLKKADGKSRILQTEQETGSGINAPDTVTNFQERVGVITRQGVDGVTQANLGGSILSRIYVPSNFGGLGLYILNTIPAAASPVMAIKKQLNEAFTGKGNPAELLGDSPLLSIKSARSLLDEPQMVSAIKAATSGNLRQINNISLTSLQVLESVNDEAFRLVNQVNDTRAAEMFARSGYDLETGKRVPEAGTVWYKRIVWRVLQQDKLYRARVRWSKALYREGYEQIVSNIKAVRQAKEQKVFAVQQSIDEFFLPRQAEGAANTVELDAGRRLIQTILNRPDEYINNPKSFKVDGVAATDLFGEDASPLDVIEALRAPNMEYITNKKDAPNYLDSAITVANWQLNHYNSLRNLTALDGRAKTLQKFDGKNLEAVEKWLLENYEPDKAFKSANPDPRVLNQEILKALGAAIPEDLKELQTQINNGNIYIEPLELFWQLISYLGRDKEFSVLRRLPPSLLGQLAQFLVDKRTQLEESAISGGIDEKGSLVFRAEALKQAEITAQSLEAFAKGLPDLGDKLISTEKGEAQKALREIATVLDSFKFFFKLLEVPQGENGDFNLPDNLDDILPEVPEFERSLLSNIISLYPKIKYLGVIYPELVAERKKLEELVDQDPEWIKGRKEEYEELKQQFKASIERGDSGLSGMGMVMSGVGAAGAATTTSDGSSEGGIGTSGGGLEARWTAIRKQQERLAQKLDSGADGGAIGKLKKIDNFTFSKLPGNIDENVQRLASLAKRTIARRRKELGLEDDKAIDNLIDQDKKPTFAWLAQNELYTLGSEDILKTAEALLANQTSQQFANLDKTTYVGLNSFTYAPSDYQSFLTVQSLTHPVTLPDALYVRKDAEGGFWYHTANQIIRVTAPRFGGQVDRRNVAIWNKAPEERGFESRWTVPSTQPDHLGIFLTANPENTAGADNPLYGPVQKKVEALLAANYNFAPSKQKAA